MLGFGAAALLWGPDLLIANSRCTPYEQKHAFVLVCSGGRSINYPSPFFFAAFADARTASSRPRLFFSSWLLPIPATRVWRRLASLLAFSHPQRPSLPSPAPQRHAALSASHRSACIACLRPWVASISKSNISQTSEIPALASTLASTHTPTDLPAFCRVRSATPHLDGRHPESAKKPPLLYNHTPPRPFFFFFFGLR